jgi:hypothetical protein
MHLNTLAGRSFIDWAIYPVFPWVLRDYHSPSLDLTADAGLDVGLMNDHLATLGGDAAEGGGAGCGCWESGVFRDLSKPMGAITEARKSEAVDKFTTLAQQHSSQGGMQVGDALNDRGL